MNFDFPTIMVLLVAVTGAIWALDAALFAPRRRAAALVDGGEVVDVPVPTVVDYARSFFPVFLVVLLLRSFLAEPFRIPSNSMMPTLLTGDFILVNKFTYGIRLPVLDRKILELGAPERGDVVVFRAPPEPSTPFIKRVVGLPGDEIRYKEKVLYVNGRRVAQEQIGTYSGVGSGAEMSGTSLRQELLPDAPHEILIRQLPRGLRAFPPAHPDRWVVPQGHYFVLGDNRDHSHDSRFWGFVPDENLVGKAFVIWFNWDWGHGIDAGRIGDSIE
jgi:signal peptidase I